MAAKLTVVKGGKGKNGKGGGGGKGGRAKAKKDGSAGAGHNLVLKPKECKGFFDRLDNLHTDHESVTGEFMLDCKAIYEEMANATGCPRSICRTEYNYRRQEKKRLEREKAMEPGQRQVMGALRDALGSLEDTPLGKAALKAAEAAKAVPDDPAADA